MAHPAATDSSEEELRLLTQVANGDRAAFRELYARYSPPLFALALRMVGNVEAAEELLQDAFVKIWRNASDYDARKSRPFTWAVTLVRRTCIDHLRKRGRIPAIVELPTAGAAEPTALAAESPRQVAAAHDDAARVRRALAALPEAQRGALELALFSGLSHSEIALRLGEPVGTVKSWVRRGLLELRANLLVSAP